MGNKAKKIAINTRALMRNKLDGIGWFTYQVVKRWVENYPEHQFYFIFDRPYDASFIFGKNVTPIVVYPPARHPLLWYIWYEWMLPRTLNKIGADIFISLDTYTSVRWEGRKITAIHDIAFALFDGHVDKLTQKFLRYYTPKYIQTSDKIVTVSNASKQDLMNFYGCIENKIIVSNNAAAEAYRPMKEDEILKFKKENTNGCNYFVFVGSIHPRKNVLKLLQAFEHFKTKNISNIKLVLIGRMSWKYNDVNEYLNSMSYRKDIILIPHSSPDVIAQWLGASIALLMVSIYEGFGVPIIEAMASGVPVVCSNISSMPEVSGNASILVSPNNTEEISTAMQTMTTDNILRSQLIENSKSQVQKYSWDRAAEIIWKEIEK